VNAAGGALDDAEGEGCGTVNVANPPVGAGIVIVVLGPVTNVDAAAAAEA
jgi:hypothetical protein